MKFSEVIKSPHPEVIKMNFSISSSPISVESRAVKMNFSEDPNSQLLDYQLNCFSLLERIRLSKRTPRQILRLRVNEVIRFLRMSSVDKIKENKYTIVQYLNEYVYEIIVKLMNEPGIKLINLRLQLGLPSLIKNLTSVRNLERFLLMAKREYKNKGYLTKRVQDQLSKYYTEFMHEFLVSIEDRYLKNSGKEGILSGNDELNEQNPIKLAAFSTKYTELEEKILDAIDSDSENYSELFKELDATKKIDKELLDDSELTELVSKYINSKDDNSKSELIKYLDSKFDIKNELLVPNFSLSMKEVEKLSASVSDESVDSTKELEDIAVHTESVTNLDDILPPADEVYYDTPAYRAGIVSNFSKTAGYVAMKSGKDFIVKYYKVPKNSISRNFSSWNKVPYKSIKLSTMDELNKYL